MSPIVIRVVSATTLHDDAAQLGWPNLTVHLPVRITAGLEYQPHCVLSLWLSSIMPYVMSTAKPLESGLSLCRQTLNELKFPLL